MLRSSNSSSKQSKRLRKFLRTLLEYSKTGEFNQDFCENREQGTGIGDWEQEEGLAPKFAISLFPVKSSLFPFKPFSLRRAKIILKK
jgi:hypothetical protein